MSSSPSPETPAPASKSPDPTIPEKYRLAESLLPTTEEMVSVLGSDASDPIRTRYEFDPEAKAVELRNQALDQSGFNSSASCSKAASQYDRKLTPNTKALITPINSQVTVYYYLEQAKLDAWTDTFKAIHASCHSNFEPSKLPGLNGWSSVVRSKKSGEPTGYRTIATVGKCFILASSYVSQEAAENLALLTSRRCQ